jgi:ribosomal protein S18 acetylase RimI-like enzyme
MTSGDLPGVQAMFGRLSEQSLYYRFFSGGDSGPRRELAYLAAVDGHDRLALVAKVGGRTVGIARYHRTADGHADIAVTVEDAWQHHGVGHQLLDHLARAARHEGVGAFDLSVLGDNQAALKLLRSLAPSPRLRYDHGVLETSVPLAG